MPLDRFFLYLPSHRTANLNNLSMKDTIRQKRDELVRQIKDFPQNAIKTLRTKRFWTELLLMTVGMFIASCSVHFFLQPSGIVVGSITGLSIVIQKLLPFISLGNYIIVINAILIICSFILLGNEFGAKTVYTALILGPFVDFLDWIAPMKHSLFTVTIAGTGQTVLNPWFDMLCFVLILSASQTILFSINASTGGLDILAKIINKYCNISIGTSVTVAGCLICCTAFAINDVSLVIVGLIGTWINGLVLNYFMSQVSSKVRVYIISPQWDKIQRFIIDKLERGCTIHKVIGGYTDVDRMQVESVLDKDDFAKLIAYMHDEKIETFMTMDRVSQVYGLWNKRTLLELSNQYGG